MSGRETSTAVGLVVAAVAACLEDGPDVRGDVWRLVTLIPGSDLRDVVRALIEEVAIRGLAPAEDRDVALKRLRAQLVEAVAGRG